MTLHDSSPAVAETRQPAWAAVVSLSLSAAVLIASEFMPISVLSPIAADLGITDGQAGQVVSVSGISAVLTSLFVAQLTSRFDRRSVMIAFSIILAIAGVMVGLASTYAVLMLGRILVGIGIGGFWSMYIALVMRLVPKEQVPRGLAIVTAGNAIAATVSAPLGSFLGDIIGWRGAILIFIVPLALVTIAWQWFTLPSLPPQRQRHSGIVLGLLARPTIALGMGSIVLFFMGHRALFTYIRPLFEVTHGVTVAAFSLILFLMGLAGVAGTWVVARVLRTRLYSVLIATPILMALLALPLVALSSTPILAALLVIMWISLFTAAPVAWATWISRTMPLNPEAGGGLQVAAIQLAATLGAAASGVLFDAFGLSISIGFAVALLLAAGAVAYATSLSSRREVS